MTATPATVADLIRLWPSAEVFADDLGLKYRSHARTMSVRGVVPHAHWPAVIAAAGKRGINVSLQTLERLHADRTRMRICRPAPAEGAAA